MGRILAFLETEGWYGVRINVAGIFDEETGRWRRSGTARGTADIHACIRGRHVSVEIKHGRDRLRRRQLETARRVTRAGGLYVTVKIWEDFHYWYRTFLNATP